MFMSDQTLANLSFFFSHFELSLPSFFFVHLRPVILLLPYFPPSISFTAFCKTRGVAPPSARVSLPSQFAIRRGGAMREESQKTKTAISPLFFPSDKPRLKVEKKPGISHYIPL